MMGSKTQHLQYHSKYLLTCILGTHEHIVLVHTTLHFKLFLRIPKILSELIFHKISNIPSPKAATGKQTLRRKQHKTL
jgi:hypothetical protein